MPRPATLDESKRREIIALVSLGVSRTAAAGYVGCAVSTIRYTAAKDSAFDEQLRQATVRPQIWHLQNMVKHAARSWRASAWLLERLYPHQFARRGQSRGHAKSLSTVHEGDRRDSGQKNPQ